MSDADFPALEFDPARGNVSAVRDLATRLTDTGTYAKEAYEVLKSVQDDKDVWTGDAAQEFASTLDQLPELLDKSHESLDQAGKALSTWGDQLEQHQEKAEGLERQAKKALEDAEGKDKAAQAAQSTALEQPNDADLRDTAVSKITTANNAWDRLDNIRKDAEKLRDIWEDDAKTCADALKDAANAAPQESFWESLGSMFDDFGGWLKDQLGAIGDIAGIVSAVAGALAFIPVLTPVAGPIALGAGAVALGAHGADMVVNDKWDDVNSWVTLGGDAIGLIPGVGAVSKGFNAASDVVVGADRLVDVTRATGATGMLNTGVDAASAGARAFADDMPRVISGMKDPSTASQWVTERALGSEAFFTSPELTTNVARALEGGTTTTLQVPSGIGLFDTSDATTDAKNAAGWASTILGGITAR